MLAGPFPAEAVIARLQTVSSLRLVSGAAALEQALKTPPRALPAAYVLTRESGRRPGDYTDAYAQPMTVEVVVVLWLGHVGQQDTGAAAASAMSQLEREVRTCLRGWSPPSPFEQLWVRASGSDQYLGGIQTRQVAFSADYRDQEIP